MVSQQIAGYAELETEGGHRKLNTTDLARTIVAILDDRQAADIVMLDIRPISLITDYFVIATGETHRQISAVVESIIEKVREVGGPKPLATEGTAESGWVVLDYGGVVVHVFGPEERAYYKLEQLWRDAPLVVRVQ